MRYVPRDYQRIITDGILSRKRSAVWSFMGSGKTVATLEAIDTLRLCAGIDKVLIVAPKKIAENVWGEEIDKWDDLRHLRYTILCGSESKRLAALAWDADIYIINFELVPWLFNQKNRPNFKMIVVDESSKLRGFRGSFQRHPVSGKIYLRGGGTSRSSDLARMSFGGVERFVELTGTPSANGIKNVWSQIWFLDGGKRLGNTFTAFTNRWFSVGFSGQLELRQGSEAEILDRISDCVTSIKAKDFFDLALPVVKNVYVSLPKEVRRIYNDMEKKFYAVVESEGVSAASKAVSFMKCSQIANGAIYTQSELGARNVEHLHDEKLDALEQLSEECEGAPLLVCYHYNHDRDRLKERFKSGAVFDGKAVTIRKWNSGKIPMLFIHPASAGHGLNLQDGGNIIVFFGIEWDLELYSQAIERIGPARQKASGHNRNTFVYHIVAKDTIDEVKLARLESKASVQEAITSELSRRKRHGET